VTTSPPNAGTSTRRYFHPFGDATDGPNDYRSSWRSGGKAGAPDQPCRLLNGRRNLQEDWPDVPVGGGTNAPHIVYTLGPDIPIGDIPTKGVYATARVWAFLDQILTQPGLSDAVRSSKAVVAPLSSERRHGHARPGWRWPSKPHDCP
jgi:hypothetical protein